MGFLVAIKEAGMGWLAILAGRPDWGRHFNLGWRGLTYALLFYFGLIVVTALILSAPGLPTLLGVLAILLVNAPLVVAMTLAVVLSGTLFRWNIRPAALLVPGFYALGLFPIGRVLLEFIGSAATPLTLGIVGFLLYREGRVVAGRGMAGAVGFAVLSVVVLVAVPLSLYMLAGPMPGT